MKKIIYKIFLLINIIGLSSCNFITTTSSIDTTSNYTFFPTNGSSLNIEILNDIFNEYITNNETNITDYTIINFSSKEISEKYNIDLIKVIYNDKSNYYIRNNKDIYYLNLSYSNHYSNNFTHFAITDINKDGYIEILSSINALISYENVTYINSQVIIFDTKSKYIMKLAQNNNINYFKENSDGIICVYNVNDEIDYTNVFIKRNINQDYYDKANNLYDEPTLNTANYKFKIKQFKDKCKTFKVEVNIDDSKISFPYLFKNSINHPVLNIYVKMTYLGKAFSYTSPHYGLEGAKVSFVNENYLIKNVEGGYFAAQRKFEIYPGTIIESTNIFYEELNNLYNEGKYDIRIKYENIQNNIQDEIIIKDFFELKR